ncbi:MAG: GIY-YIG nuclease family protein [bacterium]|nr:GIY-YIG nuclease family protein [bacterium]
MGIRGWVYVIENKSMPGLVKIGYSTKDPILRAGELRNTGTPYPYIVVYDVLVEEPRDHEQRLHKVFEEKREGKEWFRCSAKDAIYKIREIIGDKALIENVRIILPPQDTQPPQNNVQTQLQCVYTNCQETSIDLLEGRPYCKTHLALMKYYNYEKARNREYSIQRLKTENVLLQREMDKGPCRVSYGSPPGEGWVF